MEKEVDKYDQVFSKIQITDNEGDDEVNSLIAQLEIEVEKDEKNWDVFTRALENEIGKGNF